LAIEPELGQLSKKV